MSARKRSNPLLRRPYEYTERADRLKMPRISIPRSKSGNATLRAIDRYGIEPRKVAKVNRDFSTSLRDRAIKLGFVEPRIVRAKPTTV